LGQVEQNIRRAHTAVEVEFAVADEARLEGDAGAVERAAVAE